MATLNENDQKFVEVFQNATSLDDALKNLPEYQNLDVKKAKNAISFRAASLRNKGVELKKFPRGRKKLILPMSPATATPTQSNPVMEE